jgi:hypothetical protein
MCRAKGVQRVVYKRVPAVLAPSPMPNLPAAQAEAAPSSPTTYQHSGEWKENHWTCCDQPQFSQGCQISTSK